MLFTYYGHSCFSIKVGSTHLLFDPFISKNELAKHIDTHSIQADYILVSHAHFDHMDDLLPLSTRTGATLISNYEIVTWALKNGIKKAHPMNFGTAHFNFGTLTYQPAQHSSSFADGSYGGNAGGFILSSPQGSFYYSGDTSLTMEMQLVPHYSTIEVAILPIGGNFTMDAKDVLKASELVQCNTIIGVHFDTFGYIKIDKEKTKKMFSDAGKNLVLPEIGTSYDTQSLT
jgi:L-ascorbate metabolism protein UlaG (beta-lactamase superfamily)